MKASFALASIIACASSLKLSPSIRITISTNPQPKTSAVPPKRTSLESTEMTFSILGRSVVPRLLATTFMLMICSRRDFFAATGIPHRT
jgi:hypothetical protein